MTNTSHLAATQAHNLTHPPRTASPGPPRELHGGLHGGLQQSSKPSGRSSPRRGGRKWLMRGLTLLLASLIALLTAEIALRALVLQEGKRLATYDPVLGWRGRPYGSGVYARKSDNIAVSFTYNELGYRDQPVPPKTASAKRLMLLGDSFVESLEVDYQQTFGALLKQSLGQRDNRWDVSVIGSQGYSTAQELLAFDRYQAVVQSDIVLLCFYCGNDFEDNQRRRFAYLDEQGQLVLPANLDAAWKNGLQSLQRWLYESSHVVYLIKNSLEQATKFDFAPSTKDEVATSEDYQRTITEQLIARLQQNARATGSQLAIAIIPARDDLKTGSHDRSEFMEELCHRLQIPCIDLGLHLEPEHYFDIDLHFNSQGHRLVAQALDAFIAAELVPQADKTYSSEFPGQ